MKGGKTMKKFNTNQRGNVLFLILIAVALFAALSYAVTQSSRSGGDTGRETNILNSAQITQYPNQIRTAILRQVIDGTDPLSIVFNAPEDFGDLPANRFGAFHPEGGGAVFQIASGDFMADGNTGPWYYNYEFELNNIGLSSSTLTGAPGNEIIAFLPGLSLAVCQRLNVEAGVRPAITDAPPILNADRSASTTGGYRVNYVDTNGAVAGGVPAEPTGDVTLETAPAGALNGHTFGCFQNPTTVEFVYYHVISER